MSSRSSSSSLDVERRPVARQPQKSTIESKPIETTVVQQKAEEVNQNEKQAIKSNEDTNIRSSNNDDKQEKRQRSSSNQKERKQKDYSPKRDNHKYNRDRKDYSRRSRSRSPQYKSRRDDDRKYKDDDRKYRDNRDNNRDRRRKDDNDYDRNRNRDFKEDDVYKNRDDQDSRNKRYSPSREDNNSRKDYKSYRDGKYSNNRKRSRSQDEGRNKSQRDDRKYNNKEDQGEKKLGLRQNADDLYGKKNQKSDKQEEEKVEENIIKEEPCWTPSGILAKFQNNLNGVTLKFTKPIDAEKPKDNWTLFPFKGDEKLDAIRLKGDSAFLIGKDPRVCYILCENPTVSSQHAVIQFRELKQMDYALGQYVSIIRPYIIDLESTNGTFLNGEKIEAAKYIQLLPKDVLKFGLSNREYVVIKEN